VTGPRLAAILAATWVLFTSAVYLPDVGRGLIKDDFTWIAASRGGLEQPSKLLLPPAGFFRPLVGLSFALDYRLYGLAARGYGLTNLALYVACAAALVQLCRALRLSIVAAGVTAFVWSANPHGINMATLWVSGRTSLWLTLFAILAAVAWLSRQRAVAALLILASLLSKEEAIALPVILLAWRYVLTEDTRSARLQPSGTRSAGPRPGDLADWSAVVAPVLVYFALRARTAAYTPSTAPPFYRFTFDPESVMVNALSYVDRGATFAFAIVLVAAIVYHARPRLTDWEQRVLAAAGIWFVGGLVLTMWLPVRSSLYAVFPSIGSALAAGVVADATRRGSDVSDTRSAWLAGVLASAIVAIPIYRARNARWVDAASVSRQTLALLEARRDLPQRGVIVLEDESGTRANFENAFGTLATEAIQLATDRPLEARIIPPGADRSQIVGPVAAAFRVHAGRVESR
jgi:hypothetical protein